MQIINDAKELLALSTTTFLDAHGHSASKADIDAYVTNNFNEAFILNELCLATGLNT